VKIVLFIILTILLAGCLNEPDCIATGNNLVKIRFKSDSKTLRETTFTKITVSGATKDFTPAAKTSLVELPVAPDKQDAIFTFVFEGRTETIQLAYTATPQVISPSCGALTNYSDLTVTESSFDSLNVTFNRLLINAPNNIEIFLK
jgi:Family of unknown function (DUF6452)